MESKKTEFGPDFRNISTTSSAIAKRMAGFDSAHHICLSTFFGDVLTVDQGVFRWRFKNREIGDVFASGLGTSRDTAEWTPTFDSAHQRGLSTPSKGVLTVDEGVCGWGFRFAEFWTFLIIAEELRELPQNGRQRWIQRIE